MKETLIYTILLIAFFFGIAKLTNYSERMEEVNRHHCAVVGYEADCKTKLR